MLLVRYIIITLCRQIHATNIQNYTIQANIITFLIIKTTRLRHNRLLFHILQCIFSEIKFVVRPYHTISKYDRRHLNNTKSNKFVLYCVRFALSLNKRGCISTIQNQTSLFCIVFDLHYLCKKYNKEKNL